MQSVSSRIWTRVTVTISYDDNHYTTGVTLWSAGTEKSIRYNVVSLPEDQI